VYKFIVIVKRDVKLVNVINIVFLHDSSA